MVQFIDVDPKQLVGHREGRRGRVSYPILKSFLETNKPAAQLDRTGMSRTLMSLTASLNSYASKHGMPVKVMQRSGELYLVRLDIDDEGNFIPDWKPAPKDKVRDDLAPRAITPDVIRQNAGG